MTTWVLIFWFISTNDDVSAYSTPFKTETACQQAGEKLRTRWPADYACLKLERP